MTIRSFSIKLFVVSFNTKDKGVTLNLCKNIRPKETFGQNQLQATFIIIISELNPLTV